jgi:hypothetical protein
MKRQAGSPSTRTAKKPKVKQWFPAGWDEKRVKDVIAHYENQTEEEQLAEHEAAFTADGHTVIVVPSELLPAIRRLLARHERLEEQKAARRDGRAKSEGR